MTSKVQRRICKSVFASLANSEHIEFTSLQPHQAHAWHSFLVQLGVLAASHARDSVLGRRAETQKIRQQRRREEFIKRAQELDSLPGAPADDFGEILDHIAKALPEKEWEKFNQMLTSWNVVIEKSKLFEDAGTGGGGAAISGPEAKLTALAKALQEQNPKLTFAKAYSQAMTENPKIYREYLAEQGRK